MEPRLQGIGKKNCYPTPHMMSLALLTALGIQRIMPHVVEAMLSMPKHKNHTFNNILWGRNHCCFHGSWVSENEYQCLGCYNKSPKHWSMILSSVFKVLGLF